MSLSTDLNEIGIALETTLNGLQTEFEKFEQSQLDEQEALAKAQNEAREKAIADLQARDKAARAEADEKTKSVIEAADKALAKAHEKDQAELNSKLGGSGNGKVPPGQERKLDVR